MCGNDYAFDYSLNSFLNYCDDVILDDNILRLTVGYLKVLGFNVEKEVAKDILKTISDVKINVDKNTLEQMVSFQFDILKKHDFNLCSKILKDFDGSYVSEQSEPFIDRPKTIIRPTGRFFENEFSKSRPKKRPKKYHKKTYKNFISRKQVSKKYHKRSLKFKRK
jgi:hypothetical protein